VQVRTKDAEGLKRRERDKEFERTPVEQERKGKLER
jgi:hypothetical protein